MGKVTVIGALKPSGSGTEEPSPSVKPTRLGAVEPRTFSPTRMPTTEAKRIEPSRLPTFRPGPADVKPFAAPAPVKAFRPQKPSALPGLQKKPFQVELSELERVFATAPVALLEKAQSALLRLPVGDSMETACLTFGQELQVKAADFAKARLRAQEAAGTRQAAQHLQRLQELLSEVLEGLEGGFLKTSAHKAWADAQPEVAKLEELLTGTLSKLTQALGELPQLKVSAQLLAQDLGGTALAAEYLAKQTAVDGFTARAAALHFSSAMCLEQVQALELEQLSVHELTTLVQDGVLLKLPSLYQHLTLLNSKTTPTERFVLKDALSELINLKRKIF